MNANVVVTLERNDRTWRIDGTRVAFSVHRCFSQFDGDSRELLRRLAEHLSDKQGLVLWDGPLLAPLMEMAPGLRGCVRAIITTEPRPAADGRIPECRAEHLPDGTRTVFLCQTRAVERMDARNALPDSVDVVDAGMLTQMCRDAIPPRAWTAIGKHIYPIRLPGISFSPGLELILIDCPARNLALMPNGLAYVHNALKKTGIAFETFDLDIVTYHRYHVSRLFDEGGTVALPSGREMPADPWQAEHYDLWGDPEIVAYFSPIIEEAAAAIVTAAPKMLGLSVQQCSEAFSRQLVQRVKAALPDIVILVGGFSCYNADIGLKAFPDADYMCIGEADLTVGPLVKRISAGERPKDLPGVVSRFDTEGRMFVPAPMPHNLDQIEFPRYEWADLSIYRNFNGYQLVPIIASRGCRWSRCTFCAERFYWRIRSAENFVDELEWLVDRGCTLFMFNESDLNGMPEKLLEICDEIIRRDIKVRLTGQLRINKSSDRAFYEKLHQAGFVALRFGVDAFSANTLRLQKKGYTKKMVSQNLKDCWEVGIYTEVNWVIGVPGETDADCEEGIDFILENRRYIGRLANINPLILVNGSVYWIDPDSHGIKFRRPLADVYAENPRYVPADQWFSVDPYIDAQVRKERFEHIVLRLHEAGFPVGPWAERVIEDVRLARDRARAQESATTGAPGAAAAPEAAGGQVLVRSLATHKVFRVKERFYAVPHALGEVDLAGGHGRDLPGVLTSEDETALLIDIAHADRWANSRGQYDAQERQRIAGSLYKADSATGAERRTPLQQGPVVAAFGGEFVALSREALASGKPRRKPAAAEPGAAARTAPRSVLHRIVAALPEPIADELWAIWYARRHLVAPTNGHAPPLRIISTMIGGAIDRYLGRRAATAERVAVPGTDLAIVQVVTQGAQPALLTTLGQYNLVEFDGRYYGLPHGLAFNWDDPAAASQPGVIMAATAQEAAARIRERMAARGDRRPPATRKGSGPASEFAAVPRLLSTLEGYNIVSYEGFIYGLPQELGELNLAETDVIGLPGIIRDVSLAVVEGEINDLASMRRQAAE